MNAITHDPTLGDPGDADGRSLADYLDILRRRGALLALCFVLLAAVAAAVALLLPAVYRSSATILIKEQEIPQELVRSTVTSYADERIQVISQQVMTRATLLDLVERYDLYPKLRRRVMSEEVLDRMRSDIRLAPISAEVTDRRTGTPVRATIAFTLAFENENAAAAQKIASELTTLFLNENVKNRQQKAAETTSFLEQELERVGGEISTLEQKLTALKARNAGRTPDLGLSNLIGTERAEAEVQRIDRDLAQLADRRRTLEAQLADTRPLLPVQGSGVLEPEDRLRSLQSQLASLSGVYSDSHPDVRRLKAEIASLQSATGLAQASADREQTLNQLKAQLDALRQRYTDAHPDVQRLRRAYDTLAQEVQAGAASAQAGGALKPRGPDNPAYLTLRAQVEAVASQLDALRDERKEQVARRELLAARLSQTPEVERDFLELSRELETARQRYRELREKQMQAQVAEQLERSRKAERFTVIEPALYPERPYRPNRTLVFALGLGAALFGAAVVAALRESLDPRVHGPREVVRALQVPVFAVLPETPAPGSVRRRRVRRWFAAAALAVALLVALALVHTFVVPLDVAWFAAQRRLAW